MNGLIQMYRDTTAFDYIIVFNAFRIEEMYDTNGKKNILFV